ncbi:MAG TPA: formate/nitrite transporter family protein [Terriglobia bacterium]
MKNPGDSERLTAHEIFELTLHHARDEVARPWTALSISGIGGGITMGLTGLSVGLVTWLLGDMPLTRLITAAVYPIGFLAVIIGRAQLFTENTLYPVVLVLTEKRYLLATLRLWAAVYAGNWLGSLLFAALAVKTSALNPGVRATLIDLGTRAVQYPFVTVFWSGVVAGWLLALVAWLVTGSHWTTGQALMTWTMTFVLGLGKFDHCVANSGEILSAVLSGTVSSATYTYWLVAATVGNIAGGVIMVSLLNYGQVRIGASSTESGSDLRRAG